MVGNTDWLKSRLVFQNGSFLSCARYILTCTSLLHLSARDLYESYLTARESNSFISEILERK
jgi:hypothetical protein